LLAALVLAAGIFAGGAAALVTAPRDTIRGFYDTLLTTMKEGRTLGPSGRYARLAPVVNRVFDIPLMARLAVGPGWAKLPPAQQQRVTEAFAHYVSATYADRFDSWSGEQLQITGEQPYNNQVIVHTKIVPTSGDTVSISYLMRNDQGRWQVSDVYLAGMISQLATQRSEFYSILRRDGVDGLIMALNRKVDLLSQSADKTP
jgi:phospholipid transport system substrate-binding protein